MVAVRPEVVAQHRPEQGELRDPPLAAKLGDPLVIDRNARLTAHACVASDGKGGVYPPAPNYTRQNEENEWQRASPVPTAQALMISM